MYIYYIYYTYTYKYTYTYTHIYIYIYVYIYITYIHIIQYEPPPFSQCICMYVYIYIYIHDTSSGSVIFPYINYYVYIYTPCIDDLLFRGFPSEPWWKRRPYHTLGLTGTNILCVLLARTSIAHSSPNMPMMGGVHKWDTPMAGWFNRKSIYWMRTGGSPMT